MAINAGVNISKAVGFAVLEIPKGVVITKAVGYAVLDSASAPAWPAGAAPNGIISNPYAWVFSTSGSSPVTYTLQSGSLPTGLSLSNVSGNTGQITGTPTALGTFTFTLRATNSFGTADQAFSITINTPASGGGGSWTFAA